ncbi:MAG TPA: BON domain-containing protein [Bryobacteraceae bacterium]|nr:BON domain-containing protein [Bryobacteraceae bacterium]
MFAKRQLGVLAFASALTLAGSLPLGAQQEQTPPPDNTKTNKRDRAKSEPTADQGSNKVADRKMMQSIRKSVMDDKSLSTYAHNVKIIAHGGKVTLKGPVRSEEEKRNVEQKATEVAGAGNVTSEITIRPRLPE